MDQHWLPKALKDTDHLDIEQVALRLSRIVRYSGGTHWSVLQHSLLVWELCRNESATVQAWALLHDAAEAWSGDLTKPAKEEIGLAYDNFEDQQTQHILRLAGFKLTNWDHMRVQMADHEASVLEIEYLDSDGMSVVEPLRKLCTTDQRVNQQHYVSLVTRLLGLIGSIRESLT